MPISKTIVAGLLALAAAMPAFADDREVVYEGDAYTIYREAPNYCTLFFDFANGGMVRMSYRGTNGAVVFSMVKNDYPDLTGEKLPVTFQFDNSNVWLAYAAVPYDLARFLEDEDRRGFSMGADMRLMDSWAASREVTIRVGIKGAHPPEQLDIEGGDKAIAALKQCVQS